MLSILTIASLIWFSCGSLLLVVLVGLMPYSARTCLRRAACRKDETGASSSSTCAWFLVKLTSVLCSFLSTLSATS